MKNNYSRDWLENYKLIPKRDNMIYKNYQNPGMTNWDREMGSLSPAQKGRYDEFLNTVPNELKGLSAVGMQKYLQTVDEKQNTLAHERAGYESQIQNIKNQEERYNMQRPFSSYGNNISGHARWATYNDNNQLVPLDILYKRMPRESIEMYARYYHGHGKGNDPYRPFKPINDRGVDRYVYEGPNGHEVPASVINEMRESYKKQNPNSNWFPGWYPFIKK
jgi:hypothetical protein